VPWVKAEIGAGPLEIEREPALRGDRVPRREGDLAQSVVDHVVLVGAAPQLDPVQPDRLRSRHEAGRNFAGGARDEFVRTLLPFLTLRLDRSTQSLGARRGHVPRRARDARLPPHALELPAHAREFARTQVEAEIPHRDLPMRPSDGEEEPIQILQLARGSVRLERKLLIAQRRRQLDVARDASPDGEIERLVERGVPPAPHLDAQRLGAGEKKRRLRARALRRRPGARGARAARGRIHAPHPRVRSARGRVGRRHARGGCCEERGRPEGKERRGPENRIVEDEGVALGRDAAWMDDVGGSGGYAGRPREEEPGGERCRCAVRDHGRVAGSGTST
jgi:hypothetical protein